MFKEKGEKKEKKKVNKLLLEEAFQYAFCPPSMNTGVSHQSAVDLTFIHNSKVNC